MGEENGDILGKLLLDWTDKCGEEEEEEEEEGGGAQMVWRGESRFPVSLCTMARKLSALAVTILGAKTRTTRTIGCFLMNP